MPYKKVLAGASLVLLAFAAVPAAYAANDGDSNAPNTGASAPSQTSPAARPHRVMDPAKRAALKARRQARRQARQQQQMQGTAPN